MTNKENALRILRFDSPERIVSDIPAHYISYFGVDHEGWDGHGEDLPPHSMWSDIWNIRWEKELPDVMGFPKGNPLAEVSALKDYVWPDPNDERLISDIYRKAGLGRGADAFLTGSHRDTLWERAYMLVGMEALMEYFFTEPEFVKDVFHHIMDFQLGIAEHYLAAGVEVVECGDDLGTQRALLLSPRIINEFLVPEYRRLYSMYKERGVIINFHTCGHIEPLIDLFVELGIDVINPVQATANDLSAIVSKSGGRLALQGGVSTKIIMEGPEEAIRAAVKHAIATAGGRGGYFCAPDQGMPFPPENIAAFNRAVEELGVYSTD